MSRNSLLIAAAAILITLTIGLFAVNRQPAAFPKDFPYTWLPAGKTTTDPSEVQVVRSGSPLETFGEQAAVLHPAYQCDDPGCPGRDASGHPLLFPYGMMGNNVKVFTACPACSKAHRTPATSQDPLVKPYLTAEGERIMKDFVARR